MNHLSFYMKEWQLLGAYLFGFQGYGEGKDFATEFYNDGHTNRPWLPIERLEKAFRSIEKKEIEWKCTRYDKDNNKWVTFSEPPSNELRECKRIFEGIMDWDANVLSQCFDSMHQLCENIGFSPIEAAPIKSKRPNGVRDIDDLMKEAATPKAEDISQPKKTVDDLLKPVIQNIGGVTMISAPAVNESIAPKPEEAAGDQGHAETLEGGEVVETLTPLEKARAAKKAKAAAEKLGLSQPELKGTGAPVTTPL